MKKSLFALLALGAFAPAWTFSTDDLTARLQKPQTVQGGFTQQRYVKSLDKPMQTSGRFALKNRQGLYWQVQKPIALKLRVRRDGIAQWDDQTRQWRKSAQSGQAAQVKLFMAVLGGDMNELNKQFTLSLSGNARQWQLNLQPKTAVMKQIFQSITIQGGEHVRQVELKEKQGDRTVMQFVQSQSNRPLDAEAAAALN